jgi:hypothetical protein
MASATTMSAHSPTRRATGSRAEAKTMPPKVMMNACRAKSARQAALCKAAASMTTPARKGMNGATSASPCRRSPPRARHTSA